MSVETLKRRITAGDLAAVRLGPNNRHPLRVREDALEAWLEGHVSPTGDRPAERRAPDFEPAVEAQAHGGGEREENATVNAAELRGEN